MEQEASHVLVKDSGFNGGYCPIEQIFTGDFTSPNQNHKKGLRILPLEKIGILDGSAQSPYPKNDHQTPATQDQSSARQALYETNEKPPRMQVQGFPTPDATLSTVDIPKDKFQRVYPTKNPDLVKRDIRKTFSEGTLGSNTKHSQPANTMTGKLDENPNPRQKSISG